LEPAPHARLTFAAPPAGALPRTAIARGAKLDKVPLLELLLELQERLLRGTFPIGDSASVGVGDHVADLLARTLDVHENRFAPQRFRNLFHAYHHAIAEPRPPIAGASYLDAGCGAVHPLGYSLLMCALGATRCHAVDLDPVQDPPRAARGLVRLLEALLRDPSRIVGDLPISRDEIQHNLAGIDVEAVARGDFAGLGGRLCYANEPVSRLSLPDASIDVVTSSSFLEHVDDVDAVLAELARVTVTGGFGLHVIDGADHRSYVHSTLHPLAFLHERGRGWFDNSNRIRPLDYPELFARHGFRVQQVLPLRRVTLTPQEIARFASPWAALPRETLEVVCAMLVTRKT
jgi:SAM-dependent methyltransferase